MALATVWAHAGTGATGAVAAARACALVVATLFRQLVLSLSRHSGLPAVLVAALALVVTYRLARRAVHLLFEIALALALVVAATRAGWLRF